MYVIRVYACVVVMMLCMSCGTPEADRESALEDSYALLDAEIARSGVYEKEKEDRIGRLRLQCAGEDDEQLRTDIINSLIDEFAAYKSDSALYYINLNLRRPEILSKPGEYTRLLIKRADVFAHAGLFSDALSLMQKIPRDSLDSHESLLEDYYSTYCAAYQYLCEYANEHETARGHEQRRALYADSLSKVVDKASFNCILVTSESARDGNPEDAIKFLHTYLKKYPSGTREYSILASTLAYIYKITGEKEKYKRYLVASAISDVRGAVKENMSFREMATIMFEEGDIERAHRYLKKSIADANFYSALMRNTQSTKILPLIDDAYATLQNKLIGKLRAMIWIVSIISCILVITILFILKQFKSLHRANDRINSANEKLSALSEKLKTINDELRDSNRTKEQYAGLFMEYCSSAISTLRSYQQSLRILAAQGANRAVLLKKLESSEMADELLSNFYEKFDEAILNIYPSFVEKFNALLIPDYRVVLKSGELLNTELRLFALIRIGINDSPKIAHFLCCSISTVYTYRSKMRKRAIDPDNFENEVKEIG